jgi:chromosome segregation ATPase
MQALMQSAGAGWCIRLRMFAKRAIGLAATVVFAAPLVLPFSMAPPSAAAASAASNPSDAITPVEDFSRELEKLKKSFGDLGRKMDSSAKAIDDYNDVAKARQEIDDLRAAVASLLDAVADNGSLATLGDTALKRARDKLKNLEQDTRFKPEERDYLVEQWRKLRDDTEHATNELGSARTRFAELLRVLQANEDFIDELVQIRQAQKVIDVIHELTRDIRGASDQLQKLIGAIKPPGA